MKHGIFNAGTEDAVLVISTKLAKVIVGKGKDGGLNFGSDTLPSDSKKMKLL